MRALIIILYATLAVSSNLVNSSEPSKKLLSGTGTLIVMGKPAPVIKQHHPKVDELYIVGHRVPARYLVEIYAIINDKLESREISCSDQEALSSFIYKAQKAFGCHHEVKTIFTPGLRDYVPSSLPQHGRFQIHNRRFDEKIGIKDLAPIEMFNPQFNPRKAHFCYYNAWDHKMYSFIDFLRPKSDSIEYPFRDFEKYDHEFYEVYQHALKGDATAGPKVQIVKPGMKIYIKDEPYTIGGLFRPIEN